MEQWPVEIQILSPLTGPDMQLARISHSHTNVSRNWLQRPPSPCSKLTLCLSPGSSPSAFLHSGLCLRKTRKEKGQAKLSCFHWCFQLLPLFPFLHSIHLKLDFVCVCVSKLLFLGHHDAASILKLSSDRCLRLFLSVPLYPTVLAASLGTSASLF